LPPISEMTQFIIGFARRGIVSPESLTIALVYVNRMISDGFQLLPRNWKTILLGALIVSAKMWDDMVCWNVEFATNEFRIKELNALERHFMKSIGYRMHVSGGEYARYHFALREMMKPPKAPAVARHAPQQNNFRGQLAARLGVIQGEHNNARGIIGPQF